MFIYISFEDLNCTVLMENTNSFLLTIIILLKFFCIMFIFQTKAFKFPSFVNELLIYLVFSDPK